MGKNRVAIYARVSTTEQAEEGYSIHAQIENIQQRCKIEDKIVVATYSDKGISGKSMDNRLELQKLIEDSKKGLFDEVMVWKTSRLARNMLDLLQIVKQLERNDVTFRSLTEPYDTSTPVGNLMMTMLGGIAEFERTTIIENLKMGMAARAKKGYKNGGKLLGYRSVDGRLEIVPEEAVIVRKVYEYYLSGSGYRGVAIRLNEEGFKTIRGNLFSISTVGWILKNPTYAGKIEFNKFVDFSTNRRKGKAEDYISAEGQHEGIISVEDWMRVQDIIKIKEEKRPPTTKYTGKFPLSGIMVCPACGYAMVASRTSKRLKDGTINRLRYYTCGQFRSKGVVACNANSVRADYAEEYVFNRIGEVLMNETVLKDIVIKLNIEKAARIKPLENEFNAIQKNLATAVQRKDRIFDLYVDGDINKSLLDERMLSIESDITQMVKRQAEIRWEIDKNSADEIPFEVVKETMSNFQNLMDIAEPDQLKTFLRLIINKITVTKDNKIQDIQIHFTDSLSHMVKNFLNAESDMESSPESESSDFVFTLSI